MKRRLSLLIPTMLLLLSLSACGESASSGGADDAELAKLQRRIEKLEKENESLRESLSKYEDPDGYGSIGSSSVEETGSGGKSDQDKELLRLASSVTLDNADQWGPCGGDLVWYVQNNIMVIRGTGPMSDFLVWFSSGEVPWYGIEGIQWVVIEDGCTSIGSSAFENMLISRVEIPDSVISIGDNAFYGCNNLTSITIPDSVTDIGISAFSDCSSLTSITIPDSVTAIDYSAFNDCSSLTSIAWRGSTYSSPQEFRDALENSRQ